MSAGLQPLAVDSLLLDGAVVTLRPVRASDEDDLVELYRHTSPAALRSRFFTVSPSAIADEVRRLVRPPDADHVAVVAVDRGRLLGVGCWERTGPHAAEWALLVREGSHGHGIGTLLLEHLFAAARDVGITDMSADVLVDNARMLGVLRDLGLTRQTETDSGVAHVEIPLQDSPTWREAVGARESRAEHASLHRILAPRSIAVIGAGRRQTSPGRRILTGLLAGGYDGRLYAVNRDGSDVDGVTAAPSVSALNATVDVAVVAVPAAGVLAVVRDCARAGVYGVVVISDGFAEVGPEGAHRQAQLAAIVRGAGMRLIGPNCLGFISTAEGRRVYATFSDLRPPPGPIGLVSQSGGVGLALLDYVTRHRLGLSSFVSVGNKADVSGNDLLMYWEHDDATKVCALYLESFGNARKFARVARRVARRKPIVAVTAGRSDAGARGTRSHTAAASTPEVALEALFRQAGVIRASSLSEMLDVVAVLAQSPLPRGRRIGVVSNSGGPAALAADACAAAGLDLPPLSEATQSRLAQATGRHAATANPVDTTAQVTAEQLAAVARELAASDDVDAVMLVHISLQQGDTDDVARELRRLVAPAPGTAAPDKPIVAVFLGLSGAPAPLLDSESGVALPCFAFPEAAAAALGAVASYAEWRARPEEPEPVLADVDAGRARALVAAAVRAAPDGCWLDTDAAAELLRCYAVPVAPTERATTADQAVAVAARIGYPVAVKAAAGHIVHRTDLGAVRLGLSTPTEVRAAVSAIRAACGATTPVVVQPMMGAGVETAVGVVHDASIGPMVMVALGGVATDLLADRAFRLLPVTRADAHAQITSLRASPLLFGYRGAPPCDLAALEDLVVRVARLAEDLPEVAELDLNPVIARPDGAVAVDVKVRLLPRHDPDPYLRRLSIVEHAL